MSYLSNVAAERAVLSGLFQHGRDSFIDISEYITSTSFSSEVNGVLFTCFSYIFGQEHKKADLHLILSTANSLSLSKYLENDYDYVQKVISLKVEPHTVIESAKKVRKLEVARQLYNLHGEIQDDLKGITGNEQISSIITLSEDKVLNFSSTFSEENIIGLIGETVEEYVQFLIDNPNRQIGISTGYPILDSIIGGGIRRKTMGIVGARPAVGKSVFGDNTAYFNTAKGIPTSVLDSEMDKEQKFPRILASICKVSIDDIEQGKFAFNSKLRTRVQKAARELKTLPFSYGSIAGMEFSDILSIIRRWIIKNIGMDENGRRKDCLIVYDYLKLMNDGELKNGNLSETQLLGFQTTALNNLAIKYDVPILSFCQLNRDGVTKEDSSVIGASDRFLHFASWTAIFKPKSQDEMEEVGLNFGNRKLYIVKARHGCGIEDNDYIHFNMNKPISTIKEICLHSRRKDTGSGFEMTENEQ